MAQTQRTLGSGARFVGTSGTDATYPTNGIGGQTTTAGSSQLANATDVLLVGIVVTAVAAGTLSVVDGAGANVAGLVFTFGGSEPLEPIMFGEDGVRYTANAGIKSSAAGLQGTLIYKDFTGT